MIKHLAIPAWRYFALAMMIAISGLVISALLTTDTRWLGWHFSRLGEGGAMPAVIFNAGFLTAGLILLFMAHSCIHELHRLQIARGDDAYIHRHTLGVIMAIFGVACIGVALFPYDRFPRIHDLFGYGMFYMMCGLVLMARVLVPELPQRIYTIGYMVLAVPVVLMTVHHMTQAWSLIVVEFASGALMISWLLALLVSIDKQRKSLTK